MLEKLKLLKLAFGNFWSNGSEHLFYCPNCKHHKKKLSINLAKGAFKCWICDYSGTKISQLFRKHAPSLFADYRQLEGEIDLAKYDEIFSNFPTTSVQIISIPENFQTLTGPKTQLKIKALKYLYSRGVTDEDILLWKIGFCNYGEYQGRIIIPSFDEEGNLNYFVARSYTDDWMKYKNPQANKDVIFNDLNVNWEKEIILVEGVFDAINCKNAIPLLGSTLRENSMLFQKICDKKPTVYLALDEDAKDKQLKIAKKLIEYGIEVKIIKAAPYSDIAEMPKDLVESRKQIADFVSEMDYLEYKLNF